MKAHKILLTIAAATAAGGAYANVNVTLPSDSLVTFTAEQAPRIAIAQADGSFSTDNLIPMSLTEHGYMAENVKVENGGFRFYAADTSTSEDPADWQMKWFTLAPFAVTPVLEHYLNPLYAYGSGMPEDVEVTDGSYTIYYFDQIDNGQHYNLFTLYPSSDTDEVGYPPQVYLMNMSNETITLPESDETPGLYTAKVALPAPDFKISYQDQGYWIPGFIFGPVDTSNTELYALSKAPIAYGTNTWTPFTYSPDPPYKVLTLTEGQEADVTVDLSGDENYITIDPHVILGVEAATDEYASTREVGRYTLSGTPLPPGASGLCVILYADGHAIKSKL